MIKDLKICNQWEDITISQYIKIQSLDTNSPTYENEIVKLLSNLTDEDLKSISDEVLNDIKINMLFILEPPIIKKLKEVELNDVMYINTILNNKFNISQYISIQPLFVDNISNLHHILSNILIPFGKKYDDETYDKEELSELIYNSMNLVDALSIMEDINNKCLTIRNTYTGLFGVVDEDDDEEDDEDEEIEEQTFDKIWSWIILTEQVIIFTRLNINQVWEMKVDDYLTYCTYIKDKRVNEQEQIKKHRNS